MSGYEAWVSWANYLKATLAGSGIQVGIEKGDILLPPFLRLQDGPDRFRRTWVSQRMCQGWLVVSKLTTEPLAVTAGKALDTVLRLTYDAGSLEKWDHTTTPKTQVGLFIPKVIEVTGDMSSDPDKFSRVITWELASNAGS